MVPLQLLDGARAVSFAAFVTLMKVELPNPRSKVLPPDLDALNPLLSPDALVVNDVDDFEYV